MNFDISWITVLNYLIGFWIFWLVYSFYKIYTDKEKHNISKGFLFFCVCLVLAVLSQAVASQIQGHNYLYGFFNLVLIMTAYFFIKSAFAYYRFITSKEGKRL